MPLSDRPEFRAWLARRNEGRVGSRHGDPSVCGGCGARRPSELMEAGECLVCLALEFGVETAETSLANAIAGFVRAAENPQVLARVLAETVAYANEVVDLHAPAPEAA